MEFKNLTDEQKAKVRELDSAEEILAYAKEEGIDLSDDDLEAISGGSGWGVSDCGFDPDYR